MSKAKSGEVASVKLMRASRRHLKKRTPRQLQPTSSSASEHESTHGVRAVLTPTVPLPTEQRRELDSLLINICARPCADASAMLASLIVAGHKLVASADERAAAPQHANTAAADARLLSVLRKIDGNNEAASAVAGAVAVLTLVNHCLQLDAAEPDGDERKCWWIHLHVTEPLIEGMTFDDWPAESVREVIHTILRCAPSEVLSQMGEIATDELVEVDQKADINRVLAGLDADARNSTLKWAVSKWSSP